MPCPVRWMKNGPNPAAAITRRAARSTSWAGTPGPAAATPASWAARTTSYTSRKRAGGSPTKKVRVMSEW